MAWIGGKGGNVYLHPFRHAVREEVSAEDVQDVETVVQSRGATIEMMVAAPCELMSLGSSFPRQAGSYLPC